MTFPSDLRLSFMAAGVRYVAVTAAEATAGGVDDATILAAAKAGIKASVDGIAESLRSLMVTPGSGQAMEYQEAQAQAFTALAAVQSGATPAPSSYPMLAASIGIDIDPQTKARAVDVAGVARSVVAAYQAWSLAGAAIRKARLEGKDAIDAAADYAGALAARDAIVWPALG